MSIRFNHASNTITGTNTINLVVEGGTTSSPRPLILNASYLVIPNKQLPIGQAGALVFDTTSKSLKYHNGVSWVELLSQTDILAPVNVSLVEINNQLAKRVSTVSYSSSAVPGASISGTNLNIVFPTTGGSTTDIPGLFTSSPPGSAMNYSLTSGQTVASIREQLSGVAGGQNGRTGTQANPFVTKTGWTFGDGLWWSWAGSTGTVVKQVPNLNQGAYIKSITTTGVTQTSTVTSSSGTISNTTITEPLHYHGTGTIDAMSGQGGDDGYFIFGKTWNDGNSYSGIGVGGDNQFRSTKSITGSDSRLALSTTLAIYPNGNTTSHSHTISSLEPAHITMAVIYNIAEPATALSLTQGDSRYVLKSGDVMTGELTIASSATITSNDTTVPFFFKTTAGVERAAIFHNSTLGTLNLRSLNGETVTINSAGLLTTPSLTTTSLTTTSLTTTSLTTTSSSVSSDTSTVNGKNVVRSINNLQAGATGNVPLTTTSLGDKGYIIDNSTGIITQWTYGEWKYDGDESAQTVTFPIPFPNACYHVTVSTQIASETNRADGQAQLVGTPTTTSIRAIIQLPGEGAWGNVGIRPIIWAVGR